MSLMHLRRDAMSNNHFIAAVLNNYKHFWMWTLFAMQQTLVPKSDSEASKG